MALPRRLFLFGTSILCAGCAPSWYRGSIAVLEGSNLEVVQSDHLLGDRVRQ